MKKKRKGGLIRSLLLPVLLIAVVVAAVGITARNASTGTEENQYNQTVRVIDRAITNCYAIEGRYPPSMAYLEKKYGVAVDYDKYYVVYDVFASNVRPTFQILRYGEGDPNEF